MAFGSFDNGPAATPMAEINTTPLVDVMLVLLVIFIITAPLFHQTIPLDLPKVEAQAMTEPPQVLIVHLDHQGMARLEGVALDLDTLTSRFAAALAGGGNPELHLLADRETRYERVAAILAAAQRTGLYRIALVTEPGRMP